MKLDRARKKLESGRRLLEDLGSAGNDPAHYDALLGGTISTLREVMWVLKKDISHAGPLRARLETWYETRQAESKLPKNSGLAWLVAVRNVSTKEGDLEIRSNAHFDEISIDTAKNPELSKGGFAIRFTGRGQLEYVRTDAQGKETVTDAKQFYKGHQSWHFIGKPAPPVPLLIDGTDLTGRDAVTVLGAWHRYLEQLIDEGEKVAT